jgi:ATP-dependent Clp protease ATP-binding subunit ClpC
MLEDGYLTDAKGRKIDFTNTVVIMTSNIGAQKLQKESNLGFHSKTETDLDDLQKLHDANKEAVIAELKNFSDRNYSTA